MWVTEMDNSCIVTVFMQGIGYVLEYTITQFTAEGLVSETNKNV